MAAEPRPDAVSDEGERDNVVSRAAGLAWLAESMMPTIGSSSSEGPSVASRAVAGDSTEVKAGAVECLWGSQIQEWH